MVLVLENVMLSESDESIYCRFSISVSGISNKFSVGVSVKCFGWITDLLCGVGMLGYINYFLWYHLTWALLFSMIFCQTIFSFKELGLFSMIVYSCG